MFRTPIRLAAVVAAVLALLTAPTTAQAGFTLVTSRAALAGTDFINWGVLGAENSIVPNPFTITSNGGLAGINVSQTAGQLFERRNQPTSWSGNFSPGDQLLWTRGPSGPVTINFGTTLSAFGTQIMSDNFGAFTAQLEFLNAAGTVLGSVTRAGVSAFTNDGTAIFIGGRGDANSPNTFTQVRISLTSAPAGNGQNFAINRADFAPGQTTPPPVVGVPVPPTVLAAGFGVLAMFGTSLRRRRTA